MTSPSFVGRYEIRTEVARGGFATVLEGWDEELQSSVAIKVLHPQLADDDQLRSRFLDEARLLRRIRSPSVVTVHDVGRLGDGRPYFVMDFADRGTLAPRLDRRPPNVPRDSPGITALVDALADGLSAIHEAGVVHRDIKPANILLQRTRRGRAAGVDGPAPAGSGLVALDERILVGDLGIAKDLVRGGGLATIMAGTPLYQAPEQAVPDTDLSPATDIYSATALLWQALTGRRPEPGADAISACAALPEIWHTVFGTGLAADPADRFATIETWRAAVYDALAQDGGGAQDDQQTQIVAMEATCPYKGLAAYQAEDAQAFFGREALIADLIRRLQFQNVLVIGGSSGSGKSSLLRAGLVPALKDGALRDSETWRIALFTPGPAPMTELHFQVTQARGSSEPSVSVDTLIQHPTLARHLGGADGDGSPLVLCIDQFEELFTMAPAAQQAGFITALSAMTDPAHSRVRVIIAVRADFYAACAQIPWLAERITANQVLVGPMTPSELRRAIAEPARRAGLYLERSLIETIIDEAGGEAGALPLVAHALVETWMRREGNALTVEGFRAAGGVAGAISQTADATFEQRFDRVEQAAAKRLFLRLVTPGENTPDTRRALPWSEIERDWELQAVRRVVKSLTEARLLTVDDRTIQIAHEALLRTWPRLRAWIDESRDDLRTRQRISHAAAEWDGQDRDPDLLYRGTPLLSALEWQASDPGQLGALEQVFLETSASVQAQAEAASAERARRTRRLRRSAVAALAVLAVGATVASGVAYDAFLRAQRNEERARQATDESRQRFSGALGAAAHGMVEDDPLLALVLAAESIARAGTGPPVYDARATLIEARRLLAGRGPFPVGSPIPAGDALTIALRPDGALLAVGYRDGRIELVDTITRSPSGPALTAHEGGIEDLDFSPDGRVLASVGDDGTIRVWAVDDGLPGPPRTVGEIGDVVWDVDFSPDGSLLATASEDGTVRLWRVATGEAVGEPLARRTGDFLNVAFSPDGTGLVAGNGNGEIHGWTLPSGTSLFDPIQVHSSDIWELVFSPDGARLATASSDGTSVALAYPSGTVVGSVFDAAVPTDGVAFLPHGDILVGGGADGILRLWDMARQSLAGRGVRGHSQPIIGTQVSADGRVLATLGRDQLVRMWTLDNPHPPTEVRRVAGPSAKGLAFRPDGSLLAAGDDTGAVQVWDLGTGERHGPTILHRHDHQVWALAFSPDGSVLATGDRAGLVRLTDPDTGVRRDAIEAHDTAIWSIAFLSGGQRIMTAAETGVRLWEVGDGSMVADIPFDGHGLTRAALSPDGELLALASTDGAVQIWDVPNHRMIRTIAADDDIVWSVAFSPDGRSLATASSDEMVTLWDVATGTATSSFTGQVGGATDVVFMADGVTLVATDRSGQVHFLDVLTGRALSQPLDAHAGPSWRVAVHPDGRRVATAGDDGRVLMWDVLSVTAACAIGEQTFDSTRRRQYLGEGQSLIACGPDP